MSWAIGFDGTWQRDIGYGVPALCDHPDCDKPIDRGLDYVCGGDPYGGEHGCGLYFCSKHHSFGGHRLCECCDDTPGGPTFEPKPDLPIWINHKLSDESWARWRAENPGEVALLHEDLKGQS